jgi:hypothetical protein
MHEWIAFSVPESRVPALDHNIYQRLLLVPHQHACVL